MNIINEQKIKIQKIKKQKKDEENAQNLDFQKKLNNLENIIELKETLISNMKKSYKNLQDKYIKMSFNIKRKEQDDLLNQAKMLKKQKLEKKNFSNYFNKNKKKLGDMAGDLNTLSAKRYPNVNTSPNSIINNNKLLESDSKNSNDIILPMINRSSEEENNNMELIYDDEKNKLDEVNEMMKKVIEEES